MPSLLCNAPTKKVHGVQKSLVMQISSQFDCGNIIVKSCEDPENIRLQIKKDRMSYFYQWFFFKVTGLKNRPCRFFLENAKGAAYPDGWLDYKAVISLDRVSWKRTQTQYEKGQLVIQTTPAADCIWIAYFAPYTLHRHETLISNALSSDQARHESLGSTLDRRNLDCIICGNDGTENGIEKRKIWVIARQHPGETMAQWAAEGLLERLLDRSDPVSREVLKRAVFYVVPNMNPDGTTRGHLRTNAGGINLNREWNKASLEDSPEVFFVLKKMDETGVDLFLDLHGDEAIPYNFIAGAEGNVDFSPQDLVLLNNYKLSLMRANPDFQIEHGYPLQTRGQANMSIATNAVASRFKCLAMTLEMPFKDNQNAPDHSFGWSAERSKHMGAAQLDAMLAFLLNTSNTEALATPKI